MLRSQKNPSKTYIGFTRDLRKRLEDHNQGKNTSTTSNTPWEVETYLAFSDKQQALRFETYLKSHSGKAFSNKRLWNPNP
jgi:putative endonuclease